MMTGSEVKNFLDSITAMVSSSNDAVVSVCAHVRDSPNIDRVITYSVGKETKVSSSSIVTPLGVYNRLWECRKLEIELVWKRTTFISAFVISCFAAYGLVAVKVLENGVGKGFCNSLAMAVAAFGFLLSVLWIAMAKGSKAWYEVYEQALLAWGKEYGSCENKNWNEIVAGMWWRIPGYVNRERRMLGVCGGDFSVSSINILLGYAFAGAWLVLIVLPLIPLIVKRTQIECSIVNIIPWGVTLVGMVFAFLIYFWVAKSRTLIEKVR